MVHSANTTKTVLGLGLTRSILTLFALFGGVQCAPAFLNIWCPEPIKTTTFQSGTGTEDDPYVICSPTHFQNISTAPSAHFRVGKNLDFAGFNLVPIPLFTGTLEGGGVALTNITSTGTGVSPINELRGTVSNLSIQANLTDSGSYTGVLASISTGGTVENVTVSGSVVSVSSAGGLIGAAGTATITIRGCVSRVNVTTSGDSVGGLLGEVGTGVTITQSYALGNVTSTLGNYVGGLVGAAYGGALTISQSGATGNVSGAGARVGGLVGQLATGTLSAAFATGDVTGAAGAGGLVGEANAPIDTSFATGNVNATVFIAGGLVGLCGGCSISDSYFRGGSVSTVGDAAGGLIGSNSAVAGTVVRSYAAASSVTSATNTGGFLGVDNLAGAGVDETSCFFDSTLVAAAGPDGTGIPTSSIQDPSFVSAAGYSNSVWNLDGGYSGYLRLR